MSVADEFFKEDPPKSYEQHVLEDLKSKKSQVESILARYEGTRNNLFYLQYLWLKYAGPEGMRKKLPFIPWEDLKEVEGALETVRRTAQKIQNEELRFPPTDPTVLARRRKQRATKEVISEV